LEIRGATPIKRLSVNKKSPEIAPEIGIASFTRFEYGSGLLILNAMVTGASRLWLVAFAFTLRLGGPFNFIVRTGFHLVPLSDAP
jgi:hypothetical protein